MEKTVLTSDSVPKRRILSQSDIELWLKCEGYRDYLSFIKQLNEFAKGVHDRGLNTREQITTQLLISVVTLLDNLSSLVDEVKPFDDDKNQRFGNKAFRVWFSKMQTEVDSHLNQLFDSSDATELMPYLVDSFGNEQRIDYGTGHEMCFVIFLMGLYKLKLINTSEEVLSKEMVRNVSHQLLTIFSVIYLPLVRKIQLRYRLEPAGSHGAFSLDDFQFLPFYFGSAQMVGHPDIEPHSFPDPEVAKKYANDYIFYSAINFIHEVKRGPFAEHSNQLWNISGVDDWSKINRGLLNMYIKEYLPKFPIVQHLVFGQKILDQIGGIYLSKTIFKTHPNIETEEICDEIYSKTSDCIDEQEASGLSSQTVIKFEYHIVYSISYSVPVLYFTANNSDGSVVQFEDICKWIPKIYKSEEPKSETEVERRDESDLYREFGSMLTQMEHPLLMRPFYCIHPCHTSTLMKNIFGTKGIEDNRSIIDRNNYLISWLTTIGPVAGLHLSLEYAKINQ